MYQDDTEVLFPPRLIPVLRDLRGASWQDLVDQVASQDGLALERLAFVFMMVQLGGCGNCQSDSYRAMRGCTLCASQTIRRYRGSDEELVKLFQEACLDVKKYIEKNG